MKNNERVEKLVESCIKWINENEFGNYHGSLRTLVSWFAKTDRVFQWTSMAEVDEAAKQLMELLDRGPVTIQRKNVYYDGPTVVCRSCGSSLVATRLNKKQSDMCQECYDSMYGYAIEGIEDLTLIEEVD